MGSPFYLFFLFTIFAFVRSTTTTTVPDSVETSQTTLQDCYKLRPPLLDATGRVPSGLAKGNFDFQGDYDECYEGDGLYTFVVGTFRIVSTNFHLVNFSKSPTFLRWGICLPKECNVTAFVENFGLEYLSKVTSGGAYYFESISSLKVTTNPDPPLTPSAICFIVFCGILIFFGILGTGYEYAIFREENFEKLNPDDGEEKGLITSSFDDFVEIRLDSQSEDELISELPTHPEDQNPWHYFFQESLLSFSMIRNFADFAQIKDRDTRTAALDGIRVFAILWVLLGHSYVFLIYVGVTNPVDIPQLEKRFLFQFVVNGTFSVDVFFVLSGFLMTFLIFKTLTKDDGRLRWGLVYFHRLWRLSPLYYLTIFYMVSIFDYMLRGPIAGMVVLSQPCRDEAWANVIYLNNLFPRSGNSCLDWTWYLALDMQFFIIAVPIIYLLYHKKKIGFTVLFFLCAAGYLTTACFVILKGYNIGDLLLKLNLGSDVDGDGDDFDEESDFEREDWQDNYRMDIYKAPWARFQVYAIGIVLGFYCSCPQLNFKLGWVSQVLAMTFSFIIMVIPLYLTYWGFGEDDWSLAENIIYLTFGRSVFALGLAGVIFLCFTGNGGFINWFFSWGIFQVLSKLTYGVYLFHFIVMTIYFVSFRHLPYLNDSASIMYFFATSLMTFVIAFALHLTFEIPFAKLEKAFLIPFLTKV